MNKLKYILFGLLLVIAFMPNVYAKDNVEIKSITLDSKSTNTEINTEPTHNGLVMDFDLTFKQKDDFAKFKVIIKNDTNIDYKISNDTSFNKSDHITYKYEVEDVLKPKGETTVYVTITYSNPVDPSELVNGVYKEENKAVLQLLNKEGQIVNPNTGINTYLFIIILLVAALVITLLFKKQKRIKTVSLIIISILLIPSLVHAAETLRLTINTKVEIEGGYRVQYIVEYGGYFTNEELERYDMSDSICDNVYYLGSISEENKYTYCKNDITLVDEEIYDPGSTVTLKSIAFTSLKLGIIQDNGQRIDYCEEQSENVFVCPADLEKSEIAVNEWKYESEYNPTWKTNDKEIMNFSNIYNDRWDSSHYFYVNAPQTFTMPNHDVTFVINLWGDE